MKKFDLLKNVAVAMLLFVATLPSYAQTKGFSSFDTEKLLQEEMKSSLTAEKALTSETMIYGDVVEPEHYKIGPGDVLSYYNFNVSTSAQFMTVSPECSVYIPRIGELSIKDMTLDEAKKAIIERVKQNQSNAAVSVGLYKPRRVYITVSGNTLFEGTYSLPASYRVSTAIAAVSQLTDAERSQPVLHFNYEQAKNKKRKNEKKFGSTGFASQSDFTNRNIFLVKKNGTSQNVDIEKARVTGDVSFDPYITENDKIIIPYENDDNGYVTVIGAVMQPTSVSWKQGDKISEIIKMSGGLAPNADLDNVILTDAYGVTTEIKIAADGSVLNDAEVAAGGTISVEAKSAGAKKSDVKHGFVSVRGEVNNPGTYPIIEGETRVKDVITLAGGFTSAAYLPLGTIYRSNGTTDISKFDDSYFEFYKVADLTMEDSTRTRYALNNLAPIVSCNLADLYVNNSDADNVLIRTGDYINIPKCPNNVYVFGYVKKPGYVDFVPGQTLEWYLERAGGVSEGGKKGRARIIRGSTGVWADNDKDTFVYAGDRIYVPTSPDNPPGTQLQTYSLIITAFVSIASLMLSVYQMLFKN